MQDTLSTGQEPLIYYDGKALFHVTEPEGCRYKCRFTQKLEDLGKGDVAVFSGDFNVSDATDLREKGVLIAFESSESPVHMPPLNDDQLEQVCPLFGLLVPVRIPMYGNARGSFFLGCIRDAKKR